MIIAGENFLSLKDVNMAKMLKWGVLGLLAVALLIKLSLWLSVRSVMDDAIEQMAPYMDIKYSGITSSFDGRVGLEKVEIRVPAWRWRTGRGHRRTPPDHCRPVAVRQTHPVASTA